MLKILDKLRGLALVTHFEKGFEWGLVGIGLVVLLALDQLVFGDDHIKKLGVVGLVAGVCKPVKSQRGDNAVASGKKVVANKVIGIGLVVDNGGVLRVGQKHQTCVVIGIYYGQCARPAGELSVTRVELPLDARDNIAGQVADADLALLPYVHSARGLSWCPRGFGAALGFPQFGFPNSQILLRKLDH